MPVISFSFNSSMFSSFPLLFFCSSVLLLPAPFRHEWYCCYRCCHLRHLPLSVLMALSMTSFGLARRWRRWWRCGRHRRLIFIFPSGILILFLAGQRWRLLVSANLFFGSFLVFTVGMLFLIRICPIGIVSSLSSLSSSLSSLSSPSWLLLRAEDLKIWFGTKSRVPTLGRFQSYQYPKSKGNPNVEPFPRTILVLFYDTVT